MELALDLRPATFEDRNLLLAWRNDPATRQASLTTHLIAWEEHLNWLRFSLQSPVRQIFVAEVDHIPVGTIRSDLDQPPGIELSWTVAPDFRGQGIGKAMASAMASRLTGPLRARIKGFNRASQKIAEHIGLHLAYQDSTLLVFSNG